MATATEFLARMIAGLQLQRPEWEIVPGTPEYAILEAVALEEERQSLDSLLNDYHWDINAKSGAALDSFVQLFGFQRIPGGRATGVVTFSRGSAAPQNYSIPTGTQVYVPATTTNIATYFRTMAPAILEAGSTSVDVSVEASAAGAFTNIEAGAITSLRDQLPGITAVTNELAFTGGADPELDSALRIRWRRTIFRNLAGTESYYLSRVFADPDVSRAVVIGPQITFAEQLTLATGNATSQIVSIGKDAKYIIPYSSFMGYHMGQTDEVIGVRAFVGSPATNDFSLSTNPLTIPPVLTINNSAKFPDGMIVDLEYDYTAKSSRNDPSTGVLDKVDIFVAAEVTKKATEHLGFGIGSPSTPPTAFGTGAGGTLDRTLFIRSDGTTNPRSGNLFTKVFKVPLVSLPDTIGVGGTVYVKNVDYWEVYENVQGGTRYSPRALDGIEWLSTANGAGAGGTQSQITPNGTQFIVTYDYNQVIDRIDNQFDRERRVGQDVLVHKGQFRRLRFNLAVMLVPGTDLSGATTDAATALQTWLGAKDFRDNVQVTDVLQVVGQVSGIDNVRLVGAPIGVTSMTLQSGTTYRVTTPVAHGLVVGSAVTLVGFVPTGYNGTFSVTNLVNTTQFDINVGSNPGAVTTFGEFGNEASQTEVQRLTFVGAGWTSTSTFKLKVGTAPNQETTAAIAYGASTGVRASNIQAALEALVYIDPGDVTVTATGATADITFRPNASGPNRWGYRNVDAVIPTSITGAGTNPSITVAEIIRGQGYGMETIARDGLTITNRNTNDIYLASDAVPIFHSVVLVPKTRNTW